LKLANAGYSGTPLSQKLGLRDGQVVGFLDLPETLEGLKQAAQFNSAEALAADGIGKEKTRFDVLHLFLTDRSVLRNLAQSVRTAIRRDGMVWISWPKQSSKVPTDITEDVIREVLLPLGLVDVKVCAVDEKWSGLKMVIRKELR
jgi:hypothetical protein